MNEVALAASFNEWGHLVLTEDGRSVFLKRVSTQAAGAGSIPKLKIILLSGKGEECDL
jgi:hypothetical protein